MTIFLIILWSIFLTMCDGQGDMEALHYPGKDHKCDEEKNETFSSILLSCTKCLWNYDLTTISKSVTGGDVRCPCPRPLDPAAPYWKEYCIKCTNDTLAIDPLTCVTPPTTRCPSGHIIVTSEVDGSVLVGEAKCVKCSEGYIPSENSLKCVRCHPSFQQRSSNSTSSSEVICGCSELNVLGGVCFSNGDLEGEFGRGTLLSGSQLEFESGVKVNSKFYRENLPSAFLLCKKSHNASACQVLANFCTLQLHSSGGSQPQELACALYLSLIPGQISRPPPHIPKLYFSELRTAPSLLRSTTAIPIVFNTDLNSHNSDFKIKVARYDLTGQFLGLSDLIDLLPCTELTKVQRASGKFASNYQTSCSTPIQTLFQRASNPGQEFLDPYLSLVDYGHAENRHEKLYPLPVKIQNFLRNGQKVNGVEDKDGWQLVRRFFILDTISGFEDFEKDKTPKVVRYLEDVKITIQLQNSGDAGKIYVPLITLTYREVISGQFSANQMVNFNFKIEYFMDMSRSIEDVKISIGVISSLAIMLAALRTWGWNRRGGKSDIDVQTLISLVTTCCGYLADSFFLVTFSTALYWFIFFKKQVAVHVLLPLGDQEKLITDLLIATFALKIVEIVKLIGRQVRFDIFFIDWERPRARNTIKPPNEKPKIKEQSASGDNKEKSSGLVQNNNDSSESEVSIWRTYFIANEFAEIQTTRKIHLATHLIICIFFLEILGFKNWGYGWPDGRLQPGDEVRNIPFSTSARFAVGALVFGTIGIFEWIYVVGIYERYIGNKIQDFVDICTLSNVSVFIQVAHQFGYYIHGRSVHGFADTDMQTMIEQLSREEEDLCGRRGLVPSTDQQTFMISVPKSFRTVYNQVLQPLYASSKGMSGKGGGKGRGFGGKSGAGNGGGGLNLNPNGLNLCVQAYHSMNRFLTAFLEHALSDLDYDVTNKSFFETTLDMEFGDVGNDRAIFYTDNGHSFDSVLFYGNERTLFMFNLYTFIFVEILSHNFLLAAIVTYAVDMVTKCIRNSLGKRNLARKTLIDGRFLI